MTSDPLRIDLEDVRQAESAALIARLTEELARRYDDDGQGDWRLDDVLVPRSGFFVGRWDGQAVACGAFRPLSDDMAEIKRMYVDPAYRGRGIGRRLLTVLEDAARQAGYAKVRLETGIAQPEALQLYESAGYYRIVCYGYYRNDPRSVCFEKDLPPTPDLPAR
jgi:GNAT superfamily N-acetyltransferase